MPRGAAAGCRGLYGPDSEAWRLNREAMLLLGAGPRALLLQLAHPAVAAGVADHSDFRADPWRRLAGTLAQLPDDRVRHDRGGPRRDPPPQRAPSRDHRTGLRGARPRARPVGPRHARRLDDRGRRRLARAAVGGSPGRLLRRDPTGRPRVRRARRHAPGRPRGVRALPRGDARAGRTRPCLGGRARAGGVVLRPPLAPPRAMARPRIPADAYAWTLWPSVGLLPPVGARRLRPCLGPARAARVGLARRRLAGLAPDPAARRSARCRRRWPRTGGCGDRRSTAAGSAARTACGRGRAASRRRARRATTTWVRARCDATRCSRAAPSRRRSSPSAAVPRRAGCRPGCRSSRSSTSRSTGRSTGRDGRSSTGSPA